MPIDRHYLVELCKKLKPLFPVNSRNVLFSLKSENNPVTEVDLAVDRAIVEQLLSDGFLESEIVSEERIQTESLKTPHRVWIIDPVDGTKEFIRGIPEYSVSIAFRSHNVFHCAVVYNPATKFCAVSDTSGFTLSNALGQHARPNFSASAILCSRSEKENGLIKGDLFDDFEVIPVGSIAYKLALVAAGFSAATFSLEPKSSWDIAAGAALIKNTGGLITDMQGEPLNFQNPYQRFTNGILAASDRTIHSDLLARLSLSNS